LFVGLIVTVAAVDQYLLDEHPETEVAGLIWRVSNALERVTDLEAVLELTDEAQSESIRLLVRYLRGPTEVLSARYLHPEGLRDEIFTVERDLLSHYIPQQNLIVIKRWVGIPLAKLALAGFDLQGLQSSWEAGNVKMQVLQDVPGFPTDLFPSSLTPSETISGVVCDRAFSLCLDPVEEPEPGPSIAAASESSLVTGSSIRGGLILEVRDASTGELARMIWIDRDTYLIDRVVFFRDGRRSTSIRVQRITLDQGLTADEVLRLPRDADVIRG
jgi:hypothetical protein